MIKYLLRFSSAWKTRADFSNRGKTKRYASTSAIAVFCLLASGSQLHAQYSPVAVTGYTADVVAEGTGAVLALTTNDVDGANYNFMAAGYTNPANVTTTRGLPANGIINTVVAATPGLSYQLAPYTANNSLRIAGINNATLTFATPTAAEKVYVLATSGSGTSPTTITINFANNTTQVFTQTVADWYGATGFAMTGLGRVNKTDNGIDNNTTNPRLYQYELSITSANFNNPIQSITFAKTTTGGVLNVMGISVKTPPAGCAGTPTAGTSPATLATCPGNTLAIASTGATFATGISHQWQQSTDNGATWVNVVGGSGATTTTYTTPAITSTNTGIQYKLVTTCSTSGLSATSNVTTVTVNSFLNCYCASNAVNTTDSELLNVTFGTLNNSSTCSTTGGTGSTQNTYSNYKATVAAPLVTQGDVVVFSAQVGTCGLDYAKGVKVYIDYNQNGVLTDAGEEALFMLAPSTAPQTLSGNITIPFSALPGTTLMRVVLRESGTAANITPCGTYSWGETEDYLVTIVAATPCSGTPTVGSVAVTSAAGNQVCGSGSFTLTYTGPSGFSGLVRQWQASTDAVTFTDIPGANGITYTTPTISATGTAPVYNYYQLRLTCTNSTLADETTPEVVIVNPNPVVTATAGSPTLCTGASTGLTATSNITGSTFSWSPAAGLSSPTGATVTATPTASTNYVVTATAAGCSTTATAGIMVSAQFFSNTLGNTYSVVGTAVAQANDFYQVTAAANNQTGAAWNNSPITLNSPFDFTFTVNLCGGADGMGFVLQNSGLAAIGEGGGSMGYYGAQTDFTQSIGAMLKIYQTSQLIVTKNKNATALSTTAIAPNIANCADRPLRITWDPATTELKVYFDNILRYTLTENIVNTVFGGNAQVYFGFTGATGGVNAVQKFKPETLTYAPVYTVNGNQAANLFNFNSLSNLAQILNCTTLPGPVTVNVAPNSGPYTGQLLLGQIAGASATNTFTLNGNGNVVNFCSNSATNRDIIRLDGTSHLNLNGFILNATCNYGWGIHLMGNVSNVTLANNTINLNAAESNVVGNMNGIISANSLVNPQNPGGVLTNVTISDNTITQGYHGIRLQGPGFNPASTGVLISNNTLTTPMGYGIDVRFLNNPTITQNQITMRTGMGYFSHNSVGLVLVNIENGLTLTRNKVVNAGSMGAYLFNINVLSTTRGLIANNMLGAGFQNPTLAHALQLNNASHLDVFHNSAWVDNAPTGSAFYVSNVLSRFIDARNNSFAYTGPGTGYAMQANTGNVNFTGLNNNNYYSPGAKFVRYANADRADLLAVQTSPGLPGHNQLSMAVPPQYVSATDLHLQAGSVLIGQGAALPGVTVDYDGQTRPAAPTIGADEPVAGPRVVTAATVGFEVSVYPNPFEQEITLQLATAEAGQVHVTLTDMLGRQIYSQLTAVNAGQATLQLTLNQALPQGVYVLQVRQGDATGQIRVVKQ